ncbi:Permease of the major facilitator superfamily [Phaffia rhodozyma]|uniref:Permease of the major facilitator superfamily n=1 Tax=Phaffia rhodozyma TaxID=264483 RepID=A0A0F7SNF6_PHARH|nr:Permease of the major facilitator superfamily [Phaffia rhodozyma]
MPELKNEVPSGQPTRYEEDIENKGSKGSVDVDVLSVRESRLPESLRDIPQDELDLMKRKLVRKMDWVIFPIIGVLYILNYIDRQNLSAAKVQGIMADLGLTTEQFATAVSILFVGYLPFQIPSNLLITKISRPGLYICGCTCIWGAISAATGSVNGYSELVAIRACLGIVEAVFFPGAIYYLSAWYPRAELGKRIAGLYIAQQFGNAFGGLFAAGVLKMDGAAGIAGWRWLFILEGSATVLCGAIFAFLMPEYPHNAKILSPVERDLAVWRIESESGAAEGTEKESVLQGFKLALMDGKLWLLIWMNMMSQCQGSIANFFPTVVQGLGYGRILTLVLTAPPYIFAGFMYFGISYYSDRKDTVYRPILVLIAIACCMYIIALSTTNIGARYFALMCLPFSSVGPQILMYKVINTHLARPTAKRAASSALVNAIGGTANIAMSYAYIGSPRFTIAFGTKLDSGDPDQIAQVVKRGVTEEMVALGWRYELF